MKHIHIKKDGQIRNPDSGFAISAHKIEKECLLLTKVYIFTLNTKIAIQ